MTDPFAERRAAEQRDDEPSASQPRARVRDDFEIEEERTASSTSQAGNSARGVQLVRPGLADAGDARKTAPSSRPARRHAELSARRRSGAATICGRLFRACRRRARARCRSARAARLEAAGEAWVQEIAELRADRRRRRRRIAPPAAYKMIATQSSTIEDLKARAEVSRAQIGGLVYEKGRLNQQLRDANSQLERRAEEKTAMVAALGEALKRATAEKDALLKSGKIAPETDAAEKSRLAQIVKSQQRTISTLRDELARARRRRRRQRGRRRRRRRRRHSATASRPPRRRRRPCARRGARRTATTRSATPARRRGYGASSTRLAAAGGERAPRAGRHRASMATELGVVRAAAAAATKQADELRSELHRLRDARVTQGVAAATGTAARAGMGRAAADAAAAAAAGGADAGDASRAPRPAPPSAGPPRRRHPDGGALGLGAASTVRVGALPLSGTSRRL